MFNNDNNNFNPNNNASNAFNNMFGPAEQSPIGGYAGNSHFGYVQPLNPLSQNPGWHVTTEVPGMKQDFPISIHNNLSDMKF